MANWPSRLNSAWRMGDSRDRKSGRESRKLAEVRQRLIVEIGRKQLALALRQRHKLKQALD